MNEIRFEGEAQAAPTNPQPTGDSLIPSDGELDRIAAAQVIGLETESERGKYKGELESVVAWAKREGYESPEQLKWIVRSLMARLGTPPLGEKWIARLGRYTYLDLQAEKIEKEKYQLMR